MATSKTPVRTTRRASSQGGGKPAWQRLTKRQREEFLEHVEDGKDRSEATALVKAPKGSFRALCRHDPLFEADYEAARKQGRGELAEVLRAELLRRALDPKLAGTRDLHHAQMLWDDEYFDRLRGGGRLGVSVGDGDGKLEIVLAFLGEQS